MTTKRRRILGLGLALPALAFLGGCATPEGLKPRDGWYNRGLVDLEFVKQQVDLPPKKGVTLIDSRPAARKYDPGHIPTAISIPDAQFDKLTARLPQDKASLLLFYCEGLECELSHKSAFKAEKLGYTNIKVFADGYPGWIKAGMVGAVSAAHLKKLIDEKATLMLVDARPKRTADKGMIPGAVNIPDSEFDKAKDRLPAAKDALIVFYCGGLECNLSQKSAEKAKALGYTNVMTYPEGYPEWQQLHGGK